jgi:hypothetical protein
MAPQTRTQRQAAAKKAAATRKRQSANQSKGNAKAAAGRTVKSARTSARSAGTTSRNGALTAARRFSGERFRLEAVGRQAERVVLIPIGAALEARDRIAAIVRTYGGRELARNRLNRFERRGAAALQRNRRAVERHAKDARNGLETRANGVQSRATDVVERIRNLA